MCRVSPGLCLLLVAWDRPPRALLPGVLRIALSDVDFVHSSPGPVWPLLTAARSEHQGFLLLSRDCPSAGPEASGARRLLASRPARALTVVCALHVRGIAAQGLSGITFTGTSAFWCCCQAFCLLFRISLCGTPVSVASTHAAWMAWHPACSIAAGAFLPACCLDLLLCPPWPGIGMRPGEGGAGGKQGCRTLVRVGISGFQCSWDGIPGRG